MIKRDRDSVQDYIARKKSLEGRRFAHLKEINGKIFYFNYEIIKEPLFNNFDIDDNLSIRDLSSGNETTLNLWEHLGDRELPTLEYCLRNKTAKGRYFVNRSRIYQLIEILQTPTSENEDLLIIYHGRTILSKSAIHKNDYEATPEEITNQNK
ncbi:MAG: hypothetical protein N3D20_00340 [Candidatus Pacearchaeota archaeon]|nr:hypothetical protein [Candidatus Pacearchaeota archaeon]